MLALKGRSSSMQIKGQNQGARSEEEKTVAFPVELKKFGRSSNRGETPASLTSATAHRILTGAPPSVAGTAGVPFLPLARLDALPYEGYLYSKTHGGQLLHVGKQREGQGIVLTVK